MTTVTEGLRVLSHPLRVRVLFTIEAADPKKGLSPKGLAAEFDVPLANMAYHIAVLRKKRAIDLKRREPRRGATEHFYVLSKEGERLVGAARTLGYGGAS